MRLRFVQIFIKKKDNIDYNKWLASHNIIEKVYTNDTIEILDFTDFVHTKFNSNTCVNSKIQSRDYVRNKLIIPCQYFIDRGYKKETLDKFDVGLCVTKGSSAYMRATVPVYDDKHEFMVGYVARSINKQCEICGKYHYYKHPCPRNNIEQSFANKWKNSEGFFSGATLYNIWNLDTDTVILVEGPGDVWRLYEAGCTTAAALFGCKLSSAQIKKLLQRNISNVVLCLDNDSAGKEAVNKITKDIDLYFNVEVLNPPCKDIGDTDIKDVQELLRSSRWKLLV